MLPRGPGLLPIGRNMIGLGSGFGSIILTLNADQSVSMGFRPLNTRALCALELCDLNPVDTSWSAFSQPLNLSFTTVCLSLSLFVCEFQWCGGDKVISAL